MSVVIVETVAVSGLTFSFADVQEGDVAVAGVKVVSSSGLAEISTPGWEQVYVAGTQIACWTRLAAGNVTHTFSLTGGSGPQTIALLLRSDLDESEVGEIRPVTDEVTNGSLVTTDFDDDPVLIMSGAEPGSGFGSLTATFPFVPVANLANIAWYQHDPLTVPLGTSLSMTATGATNALVLIAWRPWTPGGEVTPPDDGGPGPWTIWIID